MTIDGTDKTPTYDGGRYGDVSAGGTAPGDVSYGDVSHGDVSHGDASYGEVGSRNDVEKRWRDPAALRAAATYIAMVVALAGVAFAATVASRSLPAAIMVPGTLFGGGIGALIRTYRVWRAEGVWVIWQATAWLLLLMSLFFLGLPISFSQ